MRYSSSRTIAFAVGMVLLLAGCSVVLPSGDVVVIPLEPMAVPGKSQDIGSKLAGMKSNVAGMKSRAPMPSTWDGSVTSIPRVSSAQFYYDEGWAYLRSDDFEQAVNSFDKAIELKPEFADPMPVYFSRGSAYGALGNIEQAILDFDKTIELNPEFVGLYVLYLHRGMTHVFLGNIEEAIQDLQTYLDLSPNPEGIYEDMIQVLQTIQDLDKVIALHPADAQAYLDRGNSYYMLGVVEQSSQDFETYLVLDPDAPNRTEVEDYIEQMKSERELMSSRNFVQP